MIQLSRFNGQTFLLNMFLIEQIESLPDTTITLTTGKKLIVKESPEEVSRLMVQYLKQISLVSALSAEEGVRKCSKTED